jgi:galactokinase
LEESVQAVQAAVEIAYPRSHPNFSKSYAVHSCKMVDGIKLLPGWE